MAESEKYYYVFHDSDEDDYVLLLTEAEAAGIQARLDALNIENGDQPFYFLDWAGLWTTTELHELLTHIENGRKTKKAV